MAGAIAGGLLSLIGVVVEGGTEEAGLYLVTLSPHDVGTAGTCPILHGAPGGDHPVPSSVLLFVCVFIHPYFHLCPQPSISEDRDPSLSPSTPAPISSQPCLHPFLPPCVTPSPVPTLAFTLVPSGAVLCPTGCCRLPRSHRRRAGSPPSRSSDPRTRAAVRRGHVGRMWPNLALGVAMGLGTVRPTGTVWGRLGHSPHTGCRSAQPQSVCSSSPH